MTEANQLPPGVVSGNPEDMWEGGAREPDGFAFSVEYSRYAPHRFAPEDKDGNDVPYRLKRLILAKPLNAAEDGVEDGMLNEQGCVEIWLNCTTGNAEKGGIHWEEAATFVPLSQDGTPTLRGNEERASEAVCHGPYVGYVDADGEPVTEAKKIKQLPKNSASGVFSASLVESGFDPSKLVDARSIEGLHLRVQKLEPHWSKAMNQRAEPRVDPKTGKPYPPYKTYHVVEILKETGKQGVDTGDQVTNGAPAADSSLDSWLVSTIVPQLDGTPKDPSSFANSILQAHQGGGRPADVTADLGVALKRATEAAFISANFTTDDNGQVVGAK